MGKRSMNQKEGKDKKVFGRKRTKRI